MKSDSPIVDEIRRRRMAISARFDHDLAKYAAHLKEVQRRHQERVVNQFTVIRAPSAADSVKS